jgi:5'-phosphate synthase pdxT subunit
VQALQRLGVPASGVRTPTDLDDVDALVIPGGESTTMSFLLDANELRAPISLRLAAGMPALGTCAGMILLASNVIDGRADQHGFATLDMDVRRNGFGRQVASFETDLDVRGLSAPPVHAVFIRAPVVERVGPTIEVLAEVDGRAVLVRSGTTMAASFHPELSDDLRVHQLFLSAVD